MNGCLECNPKIFPASALKGRVNERVQGALGGLGVSPSYSGGVWGAPNIKSGSRGCNHLAGLGVPPI